MSEITATNLMIGFGLMVGLSLLFSVMVNYRQDKEVNVDMGTFISFLTIFCGFATWGGFMYEWVLILCLILLAVVLGFEFTTSKRGGE